MPDKDLEEKPCPGSCSPNMSEPPSPSLPSTPLLDEDCDDTDWLSEDDSTFYVKPHSKQIRIYDSVENVDESVDEERGIRS